MLRTAIITGGLLFYGAMAAFGAEPPTPISLGAAKSQQGVLSPNGDVDPFSFKLTAGRDYALGGAAWNDDGFGVARFNLRAPGGRVLKSWRGNELADLGVEVRAPVSGTYVLEVEDTDPAEPNRYRFQVGSDCRGDTATLCRIRPGGAPKRHAFAYGADRDLLRMRLHAGRLYEFRYQGSSLAALDILDRRGRKAASLGDTFETEAFQFRPRRSGVYYLSLTGQDDSGGGYTLGMIQR